MCKVTQLLGITEQPNKFGKIRIKVLNAETQKRKEHVFASEIYKLRTIDTAKEMIAGTDKAISQIAYDLGFQYSQHFNRVFKKNVGYTPVEYRRLQMA